MAKPYQIKLRRTNKTVDLTSDTWTAPNWWKSAQGDTAPVDGEPVVITDTTNKLLAIGDGTDNKPKFFKAFKSTLLNQFTFWRTGSLTAAPDDALVDLTKEDGTKIYPYTGAKAVYYSDDSATTYPDNSVGKAIRDVKSNIVTLETKDTNRPKMWYGICAVAPTTQAKTVTQANMKAGGTFTSDDLKVGCMVRVRFQQGNTHTSPTLNICGTGAKSIFNFSTTMGSNYSIGPDEIIDFVYDGTSFNIVNRGTASTDFYGITKLSNTYTSSNETVAASQKAVYDSYTALNRKGSGTWYGICNTAIGTRAKEITLSTFTSSALIAGTIVSVKFTYGNSYVANSLTININYTGAKTVYVNGVATSSSNTLTFNANEVVTFVYDGTYFHAISLSSSPTKKYIDDKINTEINNAQLAPHISETEPDSGKSLWVKEIKNVTINGVPNITEYVLHVNLTPDKPKGQRTWVPVSSIW